MKQLVCTFFIFALLNILPFKLGYCSDLYGKNLRAPAETRTRAKVNRYRTTSKSINTNCDCNPGIYSVVYLTQENLTYSEIITDTIAMAQKDTRFEPSVIAIEVGSTVEFPNLDPFFHNVFSYSKTKKFDLGKFPQGETSYITFDKPGVVNVFCEIHSSMRAYVHVLETPYFAVSDKDGNFHIANIASGEYTINVWQENQSEYSEIISIKNDSTYIEINP